MFAVYFVCKERLLLEVLGKIVYTYMHTVLSYAPSSTLGKRNYVIAAHICKCVVPAGWHCSNLRIGRVALSAGSGEGIGRVALSAGSGEGYTAVSTVPNGGWLGGWNLAVDGADRTAVTDMALLAGAKCQVLLQIAGYSRRDHIRRTTTGKHRTCS